MKLSTLANLLIGCSLLFTTTAIAADKCNGKNANRTYDTKANTDRKNWHYYDKEFVVEPDADKGDIFEFNAKDNDVLQVKGTGYVQIVVSAFSGNLSICADSTAAIDLYLNWDKESSGYESGTIFVSGSNRPDFIHIGSGFETRIHGLGGDDLLLGNYLKDYIDGGDGNDYIEGGGGGDGLIGGKGNDFISVNFFRDDLDTVIIDSGSGHDIIRGSGGKELVLGGSGNDLILLDGDFKRKDAIKKPESKNSFLIPEYFDRDNWEVMDDEIFMDTAGGQVASGDGSDIIYGSDGDDEISGEEGNDSIMGAKGDDTIFGEEGNDRIWGGSGKDEIYGMEGNDLIKGGTADDFLFGNEGEDTMYGDDHNDLISGDEGEDHLFGGSGHDVITLSKSTGNYVREGDRNRNTCKHDLGGCITGNPDLAVEDREDTHGGDVDGGSGNDDIYGTQGNNDEDYLLGGSGQDVIWGFDGTNNIHGGDNNDWLHGGAGADDLYGDDGWDMCWGRGGAGCSD